METEKITRKKEGKMQEAEARREKSSISEEKPGKVSSGF